MMNYTLLFILTIAGSIILISSLVLLPDLLILYMKKPKLYEYRIVRLGECHYQIEFRHKKGKWKILTNGPTQKYAEYVIEVHLSDDLQRYKKYYKLGEVVKTYELKGEEYEQIRNKDKSYKCCICCLNKCGNNSSNNSLRENDRKIDSKPTTRILHPG